MNSPKINVRYTRHLSLTYTDAKILSQMISRINKEAIKPILAKHNLEYKSFNPEPLTLSKDGLEELREKSVISITAIESPLLLERCLNSSVTLKIF